MSADVYDIHTKKDQITIKKIISWFLGSFNIIYKSQELQTWFQDNKHFLSFLGQYMKEREPKYPITDFDCCIFCSMKLFFSETMLFVWLSFFYIYIILINCLINNVRNNAIWNNIMRKTLGFSQTLETTLGNDVIRAKGRVPSQWRVLSLLTIVECCTVMYEQFTK